MSDVEMRRTIGRAGLLLAPTRIFEEVIGAPPESARTRQGQTFLYKVIARERPELISEYDRRAQSYIPAKTTSTFLVKRSSHFIDCNASINARVVYRFSSQSGV